jgi:hypothetical protein
MGGPPESAASRVRSSLAAPAWALGALALALGGCDCSGTIGAIKTPRPCDDPATAPAGCGEACSSTRACPAGLYCTPTGQCAADCSPALPCAGGGACTPEGRCAAPDGGGGSPDGAGRDGDPSVCADVTVGARRLTPTVVVVVDQSGSMTARFGSSNRWDALRDSLLREPDGFVYSLQSSVRFGLALYSAEAPGDGPVVGMCPRITWVDPAVDNFAAIAAVYRPARPIDETPTGESIDAVLDRLAAIPDPPPDPTILILATDGEPDTCAVPNPQRGQPETLAAVRRALRSGIRTYVISVGDEVSRGHLQEVANAGVGTPAGGPDAPYWVAGDDAGLREALRTIIGGELSCELELRGMISDLSRAYDGTVLLNRMPVPCDDPDGWRAIDATHIELRGESCRRLLSTPDVLLEARFPCDVVLI